MRIDSIDLIRYGHFCGSAITLPKRQPDYFVFYGNNEAGKSTLLRAISALFFGVPTKTPDTHSCKGPEMRIGATISDGRQSFSFRRRKGSAGTLLSPEEAQIEENALTPFLRELDRQRFEQFFGLDHRALREGGEEILHGKGDVGSALFQAAGLLELRTLLGQLEKDAKDLFSPKSKGREIGAAIDDYKKARLEGREQAISGAALKDLQTQLEQTKEKHARLKDDAYVLHRELTRLRLIRSNKPDVARLQELRSALQELASVPVLPAGTRRERDDAVVVLKAATEEIENLGQQVAKRKSKIEKLPIKASLGLHATEIEKLNAEIGGFNIAITDRQKRVGELNDATRLAEDEWKVVWRKLPISEVEGLRDIYARKAEILDLITEHARLNAKFDQAADQLREVKEKEERLTQQLTLSPEPPDPGTLVAVIESAKLLGDTATAVTRLQSEIARLTEDATRRLGALPLWSGSIEQLQTLKTPLLTSVERYARDWDAISDEKRAQRLQIKTLGESAKQKQAELGRQVLKIGKAGESELSEARAHRDRLWQLVRSSTFEQTLTTEQAQQESGDSEPLFENFDRQLRTCDEIADRRFTHAQDVAIHDRLVREIDSTNAERQRAETYLEKLEQKERELCGRWEKEWSALNARPLSPPEMKEWMQSRQSMMERLDERVAKERELRSLQERISDSAAQLRAALGELSMQRASGNETLAVLIKVAEGIAREIADRRRGVHELRRELQLLHIEKLEANLQECKRKLSAWSEQWKPLARALLLPETSTPKQVSEALGVLEKVFDHLKEAERLRHRIKRIGDNIGDFEARTAQLIETIDSALAGLPPDAAVAELHARLVEAGNAEAERKTLEAENSADEQAIADSRVRAQRACSTLASLRQLANCEDDTQLDARVIASEQKSAKQQEFDRIAAGLIERNAVPDVSQIELEASAYELDQLEAELQSAEERRRILEDEELFAAASEHGKLSQELEDWEGREASALAAQTAEAAVARLRPAIAQYLRLRLAQQILQRAMESYREKHQGAVLQRASDLFSRFTLEEHSGLTTNFGSDDKQVLVAIRKNKEQVEVDGLSDGTRDQLYLSLRLAAIEDHVARVAPCPVVLDDILINSDDARASAALEVFSDLGKQTQVLLFTHHRRTAELAVNAGAQMIELGSFAAAAGR